MAHYSISELTTMREIVEMAMKREQDSVAFYTTAAERAQTSMEKKMFLELVEEEKGHRDALAHQLDEILAQLEVDRAITGEDPMKD